MFRKLMIGAVSALTLSAASFAQQGGTPQEARAMLDKAITALKADQAVALATFLKGEGGFLDRDLYPFCFRNADGKLLVSPKAVPAGTTPTATPMVRQSTLRDRSPKSLRWGRTCFQSLAPPRRRFRK
jgi:hypothetical protein